MNLDADAITGTGSLADNNWLATGWIAVRKRWWLVVGITMAAALVAILYLRNADYLYTATLRVSPAPSTQQPRVGLGSLSSLASLAGVGADTSEAATPFRLYLEGVYAPEVVDTLAQDRGLMHTVFTREWDAARRVWRPAPGVFSGVRDAVMRFVGAPVAAWQPPDGERLRNFVIDHVVVGQSVKSPLGTVSFEATDAAFAARFLTLLNQADDNYLRAKVLARSRQNVVYLSEKLASVTLAEHRMVLSAQLSDEERQMMMALNPSPYAADRFGRVTVSPQPTRPKPAAVLIGAVLAGLLLGIAAAVLLTRRAFRA